MTPLSGPIIVATMHYGDDGFELAFLKYGERVRRAAPDTPSGAIEVVDDDLRVLVYAEPGDTLARYSTDVLRSIPPEPLPAPVTVKGEVRGE